MKVELILEGGGMRGAYTSGVLDCFIDNNIKFLDLTAVSAGVACALYYVSNQPRKALEIFTKYSTDKRYLSVDNLIRNGSAFGLDFIFKTIPGEYVKFDYETYNNSEVNLTAVCTNVITGEAHYELIDKLNDKIDYVIASASLPLVSRSVRVDGLRLLDGGIVDAIPIKRSKTLFDKQVLVLTRNEGYRKSNHSYRHFAAARYMRRRNFMNTLVNRHEVYNQSLDFAEELVAKNEAIIIRPTEPLTIDRFEKNPEKLKDLYELGYKDALAKIEEIIELCQDCDNFEY